MRKTAFVTIMLALAAPAAAKAPARGPRRRGGGGGGAGAAQGATDLDAVRKPVEVLRFMGLKNGDRVLDYFTGTGYYAEIMAQAVGPQGPCRRLELGGLRAQREGRQGRGQGDQGAQRPTPLSTRPRRRRSPSLRTASISRCSISSITTLIGRAPSSACRGSTRTRVVKAIWDAVKPGGTVAVIDHVATAGGDTREVVEKLHRIDPAVVRADFERAGFVLEAQSDMLRSARGRSQQERLRPVDPRQDRPLRLPLQEAS